MPSNESPTGIDQAALVFAATAAGITVLNNLERLSPLTTSVGLALLVLVIAYYGPQRTGSHSRREWLGRLAFGSTASLCLSVITAWPLKLLAPAYELESIWTMAAFSLDPPR